MISRAENLDIEPANTSGVGGGNIDRISYKCNNRLP
jgi:hypothetical protein